MRYRRATVQHGTLTCYTQGCRRPTCVAAAKEYHARYRISKQSLGWETTRNPKPKRWRCMICDTLNRIVRNGGKPQHQGCTHPVPWASA